MKCLKIIIMFSFLVVNFQSNVMTFRLSEYESEDMDQTGENEMQEFGQPIDENDFRRARLFPKEKHRKHDAFDYLMKNRGNFEMDIKLDPNLGRNAIRNLNNRWPKGRVPYVISGDFDQNARTKIARVFNEYHKKTCIRFVPKEDSDQSYLKIVNGNGCSSHIGKIFSDRSQDVTLSIPGCVHESVIRHELMHAVGFWHEQSRSDRDNYLDIKWEVIKPEHRHNFDKYEQKDIQLLGLPYDYRSIMHYGKGAFSIDGRDAIVPRKQTELGNDEFSRIDIKNINKLYGCRRRG